MQFSTTSLGELRSTTSPVRKLLSETVWRTKIINCKEISHLHSQNLPITFAQEKLKVLSNGNPLSCVLKMQYLCKLAVKVLEEPLVQLTPVLVQMLHDCEAQFKTGKEQYCPILINLKI